MSFSVFFFFSHKKYINRSEQTRHRRRLEKEKMRIEKVVVDRLMTSRYVFISIEFFFQSREKNKTNLTCSLLFNRENFVAKHSLQRNGKKEITTLGKLSRRIFAFFFFLFVSKNKNQRQRKTKKIWT